jgi:hypothetical protein
VQKEEKRLAAEMEQDEDQASYGEEEEKKLEEEIARRPKKQRGRIRQRSSCCSARNGGRSLLRSGRELCLQGGDLVDDLLRRSGHGPIVRGVTADRLAVHLDHWIEPGAPVDSAPAR